MEKKDFSNFTRRRITTIQNRLSKAMKTYLKAVYDQDVDNQRDGLELIVSHCTQLMVLLELLTTFELYSEETRST
jgi:hypothetical protein